jgi:hypothetical protein
MYRATLAAGILAAVFLPRPVYAATHTVPAVTSGWYSATGGKSLSDNLNYLAGQSGSVYRDYFVFNLSAVGGTITSAHLQLYNPSLTDPGSMGTGYSSPDPTETFALYDVSTAISVLTAAHAEGDQAGQAIYADLGSGLSYGTKTVSSADNGTLIDIPLGADALAALNASHGQIAFGGALTTISGSAEQCVFAWSHNPPATRQLVLETVPEPSVPALLAAGAIGLAGWAWRARCRRQQGTKSRRRHA